MLSTQRFTALCGCSFNQAHDDFLPDDVLPATEVSRAYEKQWLELPDGDHLAYSLYDHDKIRVRQHRPDLAELFPGKTVVVLPPSAWYITRLEGEAIKERRRQRIRDVTRRVQIEWREGLITVEDAYDALHTRNSRERGLRAFDEDELELVRRVNEKRDLQGLPAVSVQAYFAAIVSDRRAALLDFLYGRGPARPSAGITDTPIDPPYLCERHEDMSPKDAHEFIHAENRRLAGLSPLTVN